MWRVKTRFATREIGDLQAERKFGTHTGSLLSSCQDGQPLSLSASSAWGLSTRFRLQIGMITRCEQSFGTPHVGGIGFGRVVDPSFRQTNSTAAEEGVDPFEPRAPVDVVAVVGAAVERNEVPAGLLGQTQQELVEDLTPSPGVQDAAVREDSLEVEQTGAEVAGRPSDFKLTGTGDSHGTGRTPLRWARRTSISAVCWRSHTSSRRRRPISEVGSDGAAAINARSAAFERPLPFRGNRVQLEHLMPWLRRDRERLRRLGERFAAPGDGQLGCCVTKPRDGSRLSRSSLVSRIRPLIHARIRSCSRTRCGRLPTA